MQAIHGNAPSHARPEHVHGSGPQAKTAPADGESAPRRVVSDQVDLSPAAQQMLKGEGPGKSAQSTAHRARAAIAENEGLAGVPFGKVVSALNHGTLDSLIAARAPASAGDDLPVTGDTQPTPDGEAPVVDVSGDTAVPDVTGDLDSEFGPSDATEDAVGTIPSGEESTGSIQVVPGNVAGDMDTDGILLEALDDVIG